MAEQQITRISSEGGGLEGRSLLLMPVMDGHTLEEGDISSFLDGRLSRAGEEIGEEQFAQLS
jgi:hypothetical protein